MEEKKTRTEIFKELEKDPWFSRVYGRLPKNDIEGCLLILNRFNNLDIGSFEYAINRIYLDKDQKPKRWNEILELLEVTNSKFRLQGME